MIQLTNSNNAAVNVLPFLSGNNATVEVKSSAECDRYCQAHF